MSEETQISKIGITPNTIKQLKEDFGLKASKALGQNFLIDQNYCNKIATLIPENASVIEVGPGVGSLTLALAKHGHSVLAFEFDEYILEPLNYILEKFDMKSLVDVVHKDIMQVDLDQSLKDINSNIIVGNLPYNISATLLMNIAQNTKEANLVIAMVQKEVGERFSSPLKSRGVSGVTLKSRFFMDCEICFDVPRNVFIPAPNVDSCVIKLTRKLDPYSKIAKTDVIEFFKLIDSGFSMRRKMLRQSLKPILGDSIGKILESSGVDPTLRAEQCDLDDFASIFLEIKSKSK